MPCGAQGNEKQTHSSKFTHESIVAQQAIQFIFVFFRYCLMNSGFFTFFFVVSWF